MSNTDTVYKYGVPYTEGGPGSGHWGHAGNPPNRGGSAPGGGKQYRVWTGGKYIGIGQIDRSDTALVTRVLSDMYDEIGTKRRRLHKEVRRLHDELYKALSDSWRSGLSDEERRAATDRAVTLQEKAEKKQRTLQALVDLGLKRSHQVLYAPNGKADIRVTTRMQFARDGVEFVRKVVGSGTPLDGKRVTVRRDSHRVRSHYDPYFQTAYVGRGAGIDAAVHEVGHWVEHRGQLYARAHGFLDSRTKGEPVRWLGDLRPQSERGKRDKFMNPYMGRVYEHNDATEIVSMGLEYLYTRPMEFAKKDPEYVKWLLDTVRTQRGQE